jgi:hypothetical protein
MNRFLNETISDIRGGRQTWRVLASFSIPAFLLSLLATVVQHPTF